MCAVICWLLDVRAARLEYSTNNWCSDLVRRVRRVIYLSGQRSQGFFFHTKIKLAPEVWMKVVCVCMCEDAAFANFALKAIYAMRNNNLDAAFTNFAITAIYGMWNNNLDRKLLL